MANKRAQWALPMVGGNKWLLKAVCRLADDPEIFFPEHGNIRNDYTTRLAKQYCNVCPVVAECLANAQPYGIWGGLTASERLAMSALT